MKKAQAGRKTEEAFQRITGLTLVHTVKPRQSATTCVLSTVDTEALRGQTANGIGFKRRSEKTCPSHPKCPI